MPRDLQKLVEDGFSLGEPASEHGDLSTTSARLALRAYAASYRAVRLDIGSTDGQSPDVTTPDYWDAAAETVLHLQHFAELALKDVLRDRHELLAVDTGRNHLLLDRLLHGEPLAIDDETPLRTVEAGVTLDRVLALLRGGRLGPEYAFIERHFRFISSLNNLRNRLWHRGTFILRYHALDDLVGCYALPFLEDAFALPRYSEFREFVFGRLPACGIDPFAAIRAECSLPKRNWRKVALLKELARASYEVPVDMHPTSAHDTEERAEAALQRVSRLADRHWFYIKDTTCPVCGLDALVVFGIQRNPTADAHARQYGRPTRSSPSGWARCYGCTFEVTKSLGNVAGFGLPIDELWGDAL